MEDKVILRCVEEKGKLRIRFHQFIQTNGRVYANAYDDQYNCQFPRQLREKGRYYEIPSDDISLSKRKTGPFYVVKSKNISIVDGNYVLRETTVFEATECVICMDNKSSRTYIPCGHRVTCESCASTHSQYSNTCPMCRRTIDDVLE
jgi:hypothetical protein